MARNAQKEIIDTFLGETVELVSVTTGPNAKIVLTFENGAEVIMKCKEKKDIIRVSWKLAGGAIKKPYRCFVRTNK